MYCVLCPVLERFRDARLKEQLKRKFYFRFLFDSRPYIPATDAMLRICTHVYVDTFCRNTYTRTRVNTLDEISIKLANLRIRHNFFIDIFFLFSLEAYTNFNPFTFKSCVARTSLRNGNHLKNSTIFTRLVTNDC